MSESAGQPPDEVNEPDQEELMLELARRLAGTPVRDIVLQTMATLTDLAAVRLGYGPEREAHRDLPQARLAIEALRALIGVVDAELGQAQARPFREPLAQLQMLFAQEAEADARAAEGGAAATAEESPLWTPGSEAGGEGGGLWTPPGTGD